MPLAQFLKAHRPGHALDRAFYLREDVFARDLDLLLGRWTLAGHVSELPHAGDYLLAELAGESAIVVRGEDGIVRALANVCRHRGSRLCRNPRGQVVTLTCPYHAWSYALDGRLRAARQMPEDFDPAAHGLTVLPIRIVGGLIFISYGQAPPDLAHAAVALQAMTTAYAWESARIAARRTFRVEANWKLALENYHECYHCGPSHPEFSVLHALARPGARCITTEDVELWDAAADGREVVRVMRSDLADGVVTGSRDGRPLAPVMSARAEAVAGACVFAEVGFLSAFLAYSDHGVVYRFLPVSVTQTEMEVIWLVRGDAVEGRDYDPDALTWLWDVTSLADKRIIEDNWAGVRSRAYVPGPFSLMEPGARQYVDRYLAELALLTESPAA